MKRSSHFFCFILLIFSSELLLAQWEGQFEIGSGYDYNIFNAPTTYEDSGELVESADLIREGIFAYARGKGKYEIGNIQRKFSMNILGGFYEYPFQGDLRKYNLGGDVNYRHRIQKKHFLYWKGYYRDYIRAGTDFTQDLSNIPLSYRRYGSSLDMHWKLNKKERLYTELGAMVRESLGNIREQFGYHAINGTIGFRRYLGYQPNTKNRLSFSLGANQRWYERGSLRDSNAQFVYRRWNRTISSLEIEGFFELSDQLVYKPSISFSRQTENRDRGVNYHGLGLRNSLSYKSDDWSMSINPQLLLRKYMPLNNEETEANTRMYTYLKR